MYDNFVLLQNIGWCRCLTRRKAEMNQVRFSTQTGKGLNNFSARSFKGDFTGTPTIITYTPSKIVHLDQIDLFKKAPTITLKTCHRPA